MHRLKLLIAALVVMGAVCTTSVAAAFAELPEILPVPTSEKPLHFTIKSGVTSLSGGAFSVKCESDTGEGEFTSARSGTATFDFSGCHFETIKCKTLSDTSGTMLLTLSVQLVTVLVNGVLRLGLLASFPSLGHVECSLILILIGGAVIGFFSGLESLHKVKSGSLIFEASGREQEIRECHEPTTVCEAGPFRLYEEISKKRENYGLNSVEEFTFGEEVEFHF